MSTYVLIPGAGSDSWYWHLVVPRLEALGHDVVAVDVPCTDETADFERYADVVVEAIGDRRDLIVVAQSLGGFTAPLVCARRPVQLLVLVAAMVPRPGESAGNWWANTGHAFPEPFDPAEVFTHDLDPELAAAANDRALPQAGRPFEDPWPLAAWPEVPTRFLLCRDDRFFPAGFQRRVVQERLGITPDEMGGGHLPALARPDELVSWLERYRAELAAERPAQTL
jgi:pimeloyl-ACP methyl ester carboxylesterase